jgi:hypothetical protein
MTDAKRNWKEWVAGNQLLCFLFIVQYLKEVRILPAERERGGKRQIIGSGSSASPAVLKQLCKTNI